MTHKKRPHTPFDDSQTRPAPPNKSSLYSEHVYEMPSTISENSRHVLGTPLSSTAQAEQVNSAATTEQQLRSFLEKSRPPFSVTTRRPKRTKRRSLFQRETLLHDGRLTVEYHVWPGREWNAMRRYKRCIGRTTSIIRYVLKSLTYRKWAMKA